MFLAFCEHSPIKLLTVKLYGLLTSDIAHDAAVGADEPVDIVRWARRTTQLLDQHVVGHPGSHDGRHSADDDRQQDGQPLQDTEYSHLDRSLQFSSPSSSLSFDIRFLILSDRSRFYSMAIFIEEE
ncbi:unnamed protein product [Nezara viridula]|uniref:Uncharacterized protein n=1 Tax=Nezara viridula TaxID=85310 RepID=A0A9P0EG26_NEZVI|nr:unnamed protein product [Nezara viridula]